MKNLRLTNYILVVAFLLPIWAMAGNLVGNGGIFLKCEALGPGASDSTYSLLDFVERASGSFQLDSDLETRSGSEIEIAREIVFRLGKVDKTRSSRYRYWLEKFYKETSFVDYDLPRTMDAGFVWEFPSGCELVQGVIQVSPDKEGDPRYIIDKSIWSQASAFNRAGMILHELVIRDALNQGLETTDKLRRFVTFLFSKELLVVSDRQFLDQLELGGLAVSSLSPKLIACKQSMQNVLVDKSLSQKIKVHPRYFNQEVGTGERQTFFGKRLMTEGSQIVLPLLMKSSMNIFTRSRDSSSPSAFLRTQETSENLLLRLFQKKSSDLVFATLEPYGQTSSSTSTVFLQGVARCSEAGVEFEGQDVNFIDYEVGIGQSLLSTSRYLIQWSLVGQSLEEKSAISTWEVDPNTLERSSLLGSGWHQ